MFLHSYFQFSPVLAIRYAVDHEDQTTSKQDTSKKKMFGCLFHKIKKNKFTACNFENFPSEGGSEAGLGILVCEGQQKLCKNIKCLEFYSSAQFSLILLYRESHHHSIFLPYSF